MATSSIKRNFVIEGQDAENFANSLDAAFEERASRKPSKLKYTEINDENEIKKELQRYIVK